MKITGVMFYYYYVCRRKLWLFSKDITFEKENENVMLGKLLDENSYKKDKKHIMIDETINIDFIRDWKVLHEIKKSRSIEEASLWQVKYYLYFLRSRGIEVEKGVLDFPKLKKIEEVYINDEEIIKIKEILKDIENIVNLDNAPNLIDSKICKKCAYYEYCYI